MFNNFYLLLSENTTTFFFAHMTYLFIFFISLNLLYLFFGYKESFTVYMFFYSILLLNSIFLLKSVFLGKNIFFFKTDFFFFKRFFNNNLLSFYVDNLSIFFITITILIGFFANLYQFFYMGLEVNKDSFFFLINYFVFSMSFFVITNNLVLMVFFWELLGFSSFFLISHYYNRPITIKSSLKAFFFNRASDVFFILALVFYYTEFNTFSLFSNCFFYKNNFLFSLSMFFLILASFIKSAQIWFHFWLPDSMEAPIPASALIHSATLVSAGIYIVLRNFFFIKINYFLSFLILITGALTCFLFSIISFFQNDVKKILAYSTISNCGFIYSLTVLSDVRLTCVFFTLHGLYKSLSFLFSGDIILKNKHKQDLRYFDYKNIKLNTPGKFVLLPIIFLTGSNIFLFFKIKHVFFDFFYINGSVIFAVKTVFYIYFFFSVLYGIKIIYLVYFGKNFYNKNTCSVIIKKKELPSTCLLLFLLLVFLVTLFVYNEIFYNYTNILPVVNLITIPLQKINFFLIFYFFLFFFFYKKNNKWLLFSTIINFVLGFLIKNIFSKNKISFFKTSYIRFSKFFNKSRFSRNRQICVNITLIGLFLNIFSIFSIYQNFNVLRLDYLYLPVYLLLFYKSLLYVIVKIFFNNKIPKIF